MEDSTIFKSVSLHNLSDLVIFFKKSYGEDSIFSDTNFLKYYFQIGENDDKSKCLVAINSNEEVVSHYGGLPSEMYWNGELFSLVWGVNAYTDVNYRGKAINSKIIEIINEENIINGIIGFTDKIAKYYNSIDYNIFNYERFIRFVYVIDLKSTNEIIKRTSNNENSIIHFEFTDYKPIAMGSNLITIDENNYSMYNYELNKNVKNIFTTNRTAKYIYWRFIKNPFIKYNIIGCNIGNTIISYIVTRNEHIVNFGTIVRIIDLFGEKDSLENLIKKVIDTSRIENRIYIDFSVFGNLYSDILVKSGFIKLEKEEYSLLPQVFDPLQYRTNNEYLGLQSKTKSEFIHNLDESNVYFTRMDSDRDRINRINSRII